MLSLMSSRMGRKVRIVGGERCGQVGTIWGFGRDGAAMVSQRQDDGTSIRIEIDWLDTDLGPPGFRAAIRVRRQLIVAPERAREMMAGLLPARSVSDDGAGFLESIRKAREQGEHWLALRAAVAAFFWTAWNSVEYVVR